VSGRSLLVDWMKRLITWLISCGKPVESTVKTGGGAAFEGRDPFGPTIME
jgi:hypothetical protein